MFESDNNPTMSLGSDKKTQRMFENRASSVLKKVKELSTLCGTPACLVIHNPNDIINQWRIWPPNPTDFRNVVDLYKQRKGREFVNYSGGKGSKGMLPEVGQDCLLSDVSGSIATSNQPQDEQPSDELAGTTDSAAVYVLNEENAMTSQLPATTSCSEVVSMPALVSVDTDGEREVSTFDGNLWNCEDLCDVDELLKLCQRSFDEEDAANGCPALDTFSADSVLLPVQPALDTFSADSVLMPVQPAFATFTADAMLMPTLPAVALVGNKRKEPEKVFSFSELITPFAISLGLSLSVESDDAGNAPTLR